MWSFIKKDQSGMTLVELIIVLFISSLVISGAYGMFNLVLNNYMLSEEKAREFEQLREVPKMMGSNIRASVADGDDGPVEITDRENMEVYTLDENGDVHTIEYEVDNDSGILTREEGGEETVIMDDFHNIEFEDKTTSYARTLGDDDDEKDAWENAAEEWDRRLIEVRIQLEEDENNGNVKKFRFIARSGSPAIIDFD